MEKKTQSRICNWSLLVLAILMLASGIVALLVLLFNGMQHNGLGGVHGKIGFGFVALGIYHIIRRIRSSGSRSIRWHSGNTAAGLQAIWAAAAGERRP